VDECKPLVSGTDGSEDMSVDSAGDEVDDDMALPDEAPEDMKEALKVGRCRLTLSNPR
jgi:hypothetical protein